jgi:hypothetical protein
VSPKVKGVIARDYVSNRVCSALSLTPSKLLHRPPECFEETHPLRPVMGQEPVLRNVVFHKH